MTSVKQIGAYTLISGLDNLCVKPNFVKHLVEMLGSELYSPDDVSDDELSVNDKQELDTLYKEKRLILRGKFIAKYIDIIVKKYFSS